MCDKMITLWTLHSPDFDIRTGRVDHNKSEYYLNTPGVKEAYHELWRRLNTPEGQIIWCYTTNDEIVKTGIEEILWELQIPRENVICFIDDLVWNRILGIRCDVGKTLRRKLRDEAINKCPGNSSSCFDKLLDDFWNQKPKTGSWWDELFIQTPGENRSALIYHPVQEKYVKNQIPWYCKRYP
jgi:hypothetical protein